MNRYINDAADCTVKQFEECRFREKYSVLVLEGDPADEELKAAFELIYAQYTDLSGLFITREFELSAYIESLEKRVNTVAKFIELQKAFIHEFGRPFKPAFHLVKRYGHSLYWNHDSPDLENFMSKLEKIPLKEARYRVELDAKKKELFDLERKRAKGEHAPLETKSQFVTMINRLRQARNVIERNSTTVEELALMIKDARDQQEEEKAQQTFKRKP